jgi:hypothetical protein
MFTCLHVSAHVCDNEMRKMCSSSSVLTCVEGNEKLKYLHTDINREHADWNLKKWHAAAFIAVTT